jgi:hypothetical protein
VKFKNYLIRNKKKKSEHFKVLTTTWVSVILSFIWEKWTRKECIRQTKEWCRVITNINADRVSYHEVPRTPPLTPVSSHSLSVSMQETPQSRQRELTPRLRSPSQVSENWKLTEFPRKSKVKERSGER